MIRCILFLIFIFSLTNSRAQLSQLSEIKRLWTETNYNFDILLKKHLNVQTCYNSEREFVGCMMAFHNLLLGGDEKKPQQLKVNGLNLEIVPMTPGDMPKTVEESLEFDKKRRESFRMFFRTITKST